MAGLYFHIPFCKRVCAYCDFYKSADLRRMDDLLAAMHRELDKRQDYLRGEAVTTRYFGGGHYGHCGEAFTDGPADSTCRNAPVGYEYGLAPNFVQYLFKRLGGHAFNLFNKEMFRPGKSRSCSGRTPKRHRGHL